MPSRSVSCWHGKIESCKRGISRQSGLNSAFLCSVIAIKASNDSVTHVKCIFNEGSLAIGCLIVLTSMVKEITYCIAQQRDSNVSASALPMFRACKAKSADTGRLASCV